MPKKLTRQQEIFAQEIAKGTTQRQAMLIAYPQRKTWTDESLDVTACKLAKLSKVKLRIDELKAKIRAEEEEKILWTREMAIENLKYVIDINKQDLQRITDAFEQELLELRKQMKENPHLAIALTEDLIKSKKKRRASNVNNSGIVSATEALNKMQGFNEENINLHGAVIFEGDNELED